MCPSDLTDDQPDSRTVRATEVRGERGFDPARKATGQAKKRHIAADTPGLLLAVAVTGGAVSGARGRAPRRVARPRSVPAAARLRRYRTLAKGLHSLKVLVAATRSIRPLLWW